jgi:hypothetical protein
VAGDGIREIVESGKRKAVLGENGGGIIIPCISWRLVWFGGLGLR